MKKYGYFSCQQLYQNDNTKKKKNYILKSSQIK